MIGEERGSGSLGGSGDLEYSGGSDGLWRLGWRGRFRWLGWALEVRVAQNALMARTPQDVRAIQEVRGFQMFLHFLNKSYNFMEKFCFM